MTRQTFLTSVFQWLAKTEMFARPSKQLPGKWRLFEYYTEKSGDLVHVKEGQLLHQGTFLEINFFENRDFSQHTNFAPGILPVEVNQWSLSKNFIKIVNSKEFCESGEYQFAVDKGVLKLLRKDFSGKIDFFGFFRKLDG